MLFAVLDPSPLTVCINCSFLHLYVVTSTLHLNTSCSESDRIVPTLGLTKNKLTSHLLLLDKTLTSSAMHDTEPVWLTLSFLS